MGSLKENFLYGNLGVAVLCSIAATSYGLHHLAGAVTKAVLGPVLDGVGNLGSEAPQIVYGMLGMSVVGWLVALTWLCLARVLGEGSDRSGADPETGNGGSEC